MLDEQGLKKFKFFSDIPEEKLDEILNFCESKYYEKDTILFTQNDNAEYLYGVLSGKVELSILFQEKDLKAEINHEESIYKSIEITDRPIVVGVVSAGEIIGWSSFTKSIKMSASAKCLEESNIFTIPTDKILDLFQKDPALGFPFMIKLCDVISNRLHSRTDMLVQAWGEAFKANNIG